MCVITCKTVPPLGDVLALRAESKVGLTKTESPSGLDAARVSTVVHCSSLLTSGGPRPSCSRRAASLIVKEV